MYNKDMKLRVYSWIEFLIWVVILCICVLGFRYHSYSKARQLPSYQIFMQDVDGMIVGSPVKYMGVQVGYIKNIKLLKDTAYVKFVITEENLKLPQGVIATVEFSGLGGSKSLELYPPDKNEHSESLIVVSNPKRLSDAASLLNHMFGKIDSIGMKITSFGNKLGVIQGNSFKVNPDNIGTSIKKTDEFFDDILEKHENFKNKMKGMKYGECESNQ